MEKNKKTPSLISTLILTTITLVSWVFFSIYRAFVKPQPVVVPPEILEPIDPELDTDSLNKLKERFYLNEEEVPEITPPPKTETPSPTTSPTITPSPTNEAVPTATPINTNQ